MLFGLPDWKDDSGSAAWDPEAPVQSAIRAIKREVPGLLVMTDVCLCEYTSHGHCGIVEGPTTSRTATTRRPVLRSTTGWMMPAPGTRG